MQPPVINRPEYIRGADRTNACYRCFVSVSGEHVFFCSDPENMALYLKYNGIGLVPLPMDKQDRYSPGKSPEIKAACPSNTPRRRRCGTAIMVVKAAADVQVPLTRTPAVFSPIREPLDRSPPCWRFTTKRSDGLDAGVNETITLSQSSASGGPAPEDQHPRGECSVDVWAPRAKLLASRKR